MVVPPTRTCGVITHKAPKWTFTVVKIRNLRGRGVPKFIILKYLSALIKTVDTRAKNVGGTGQAVLYFGGARTSLSPVLECSIPNPDVTTLISNMTKTMMSVTSFKMMAMRCSA